MKYLIYCGPGIGDWILILPMARAIHKNDPSAEILAIMTSDRYRILLIKSMMELQCDINEVDYYSISEKVHSVKFLLKLGFRRYDYGFVLQYTDNTDTSKWPFRIVNYASKKTCGIRLMNRPDVKYDIMISRRKHYKIADYPILMLESIGITGQNILHDDKLLKKDKLEEEFESIHLNTSNPIISLVIGTAPVSGKINGKYVSNSVKNWSYENWHELTKLFNKKGYQIALLGGKKEKEEFAFSLKDTKDIWNLVGKCTIMQSVSVLCKSKLVIGADTGLMHCAGALNVPSLTLFGCTDPIEYLPFGEQSYFISSNEYCSPCFGTKRSLECRSYTCMKNITVSSVYAKALDIISRPF